MRKIVLAAVGVAAMAAFGTPMALADSHEANVVKYRQMVMKAVGAHMGGLGALVKGETSVSDVPFNIQEQAAALNATAQLIDQAFAQDVGTKGGDTEAKAEIWQDWEGFVARAALLRERSQSLRDVAETGDEAAIKAAFAGVGKACGSCHNAFRKKKS
ncbi:MAG: cytochrome c [Rhodospirillaceae bacterium]|jgi:cytochrome c556|nr:cytochrome c [Rhodospirillaceae bacterium]MBT6118911.1 cytochrome c [Rhodospirillaceae bacterium]